MPVVACRLQVFILIIYLNYILHITVMSNNKKSKNSNINDLSEVQGVLHELSGLLERFGNLQQDMIDALRTVESPVVEVSTVAKQPQIRYNLQTSDISNKVLEPTNVEPIENIVDSDIGCFEILSALMTQFPKKVTLSAPQKRKDGSWGKLYQLNIPRIDETFMLIDQTLSLNDRKAQAREMWKIFAIKSGYIYTTRSGSEWKHFVSGKTEELMLSWLQTHKVHIPKRYPDDKEGDSPSN